MSKDVICRECGCETSTPPPELPVEWHGYCPACAVTKSMLGLLPQSEHTPALVMNGIMKALADGRARIVMVPQDDEILHQDDTGITFVHKQYLN